MSLNESLFRSRLIQITYNPYVDTAYAVIDSTQVNLTNTQVQFQTGTDATGPYSQYIMSGQFQMNADSVLMSLYFKVYLNAYVTPFEIKVDGLVYPIIAGVTYRARIVLKISERLTGINLP